MRRSLRYVMLIGAVCVSTTAVAVAQSQCMLCEDGPTPNCGNSWSMHYDDGTAAIFGYWNFGGVSGGYCDMSGPWCAYAHVPWCRPEGEEVFTGADVERLVEAVKKADLATIEKYLAGRRVAYNAQRGTLSILSCDGRSHIAALKVPTRLTLAVYALGGRSVSAVNWSPAYLSRPSEEQRVGPILQ